MSVFIIQMFVMWAINKDAFQRSHVPSDMRQNPIERWAGTAGNLIWLLAMVYSIFLPLRSGTIIFYFGLAFFLTGLVLLSAATFSFITTPADQLIVKGAYRILRHPMYAATFFICTGTGLATGSWLFIILTVAMALCLYQEALVEERYCRSKYGHVYEKYIKRTHRWIGVSKRSRMSERDHP